MFDNSVMSSFAKAGLDPVTALAGPEFEIAYTLDSKREYVDGLDFSRISNDEKALISKVMQHGKLSAMSAMIRCPSVPRPFREPPIGRSGAAQPWPDP